MESIDYSYRPKPWLMLMAAIFFGGCAFAIGSKASNNTRGLVLNGIFRFAPEEATVFYWCLAVVSAVFVALGLVGIAVGLLGKQRLLLTATELSVPRFYFSRTNTVIPLADLQKLALIAHGKQRILQVHHRKGRLVIAQSMLPNAAAFERVHALLAGRVAPQAGR